jgi:hypothetical protein
MLSEILIALLVLVLGGYWFRYNCLAILKTKTSRNLARQVAAANDLSFPEVETQLVDEDGSAGLDTLNDALLRDYEVLTCLLRYTAPAAHSAEERMLMMDFRVLQLEFAISRRRLTRFARRSLRERAQILNHLANTMGERSASVTRV